jgi:adenylate kinase family enzyme
MAGPRRIVVIGSSGSGKSALASRLARSLRAEFVELDALHWEAGWTPATPQAFRARVERAIRAEAWVVAGNYQRVRDIIWSRAQAVVWLDYSLPLVFWRLNLRTLRRAVTREVLWNGNRESFWEHLQLWSERSLYHWLFKTYWRYRREYPLLFAQPEHAHLEIVRLRSPREGEEWLRGAPAWPSPPRPGGQAVEGIGASEGKEPSHGLGIEIEGPEQQRR